MSDLLIAAMAVLSLAWICGLAYRLGREDGEILERLKNLDDDVRSLEIDDKEGA